MSMDKNEFYKQLLENYTIDYDKIKCNAKRMGKKRRMTPLYKATGIAGAAAIVIVAGCVAFSAILNVNDPVIISYNDPDVAIARLAQAERNFIDNNYDDEDAIEMYVSFSEPVSPNGAYMVFSSVNDLGEIDCKLLYTTSGKICNCAEGINQISNDELVSGAKIVAPAEYFYSLRELKSVSLVELKTDEINDETFIPLSEKEALAAETTLEAVDPKLPDEILLPSETTPDVNPVQTDEQPENITTSDVQLPIITEKEITLPVAASSAYFISNNDLLVLTDTTVELYHFGEGKAPSSEKIYVNKPKISWSNAENTSMFITGCESATEMLRNKLIYINGANPVLNDISNIIVGNEITGITYSEKNNAIIFKVTNSDTSKIIVSTRNGEALENYEAVTYNGPVAALAYNNNTLYYSATNVETSTVTIKSINIATGEQAEIASYSSGVKFTKSYRLDSFAVTAENAEGVLETSIFSVAAKTFIKVDISGAIKFSALNSSIFSDDSKFYCLNAEGVVEITDKEAAAYDIAPLGSEFYSFEIGADKLVVKLK